MKAAKDLNLLFHLHSVTLGHGIRLNKTMISTSISTSISKRDSFSIEDVVSRIWISYHTRPAHHVDRLRHLPALLEPDLLRLPALGLHRLRTERHVSGPRKRLQEEEKLKIKYKTLNIRRVSGQGKGFRKKRNSR